VENFQKQSTLPLLSDICNLRGLKNHRPESSETPSHSITWYSMTRGKEKNGEFFDKSNLRVPGMGLGRSKRHRGPVALPNPAATAPVKPVGRL
jgi:hypothetical protein